MFAVARAVEQGHVVSRADERLPCLGVCIEFGGVPAPELVPPLRIVAERSAQLRAWGGVLQPAVEVDVFVTDTAWP